MIQPEKVAIPDYGLELLGRKAQMEIFLGLPIATAQLEPESDTPHNDQKSFSPANQTT